MMRRKKEKRAADMTATRGARQTRRPNILPGRLTPTLLLHPL